MTEAIKTPLYKIYQESSAKFVDFHGWLMPVQYTGIIEEHLAVRNTAGLFDLCHMGEIEVAGKQATEYLQYVLTNDALKLTNGKAQYSLICNNSGGIIDDIIIYRFSEHKYFIVVNASNCEKDYNWFQTNAKSFDVTVKNFSKEMGLIALQGPESENILLAIGCSDAAQLRYFEFTESSIAGCKIMLARVGYTGEDGFELCCSLSDCEKIWKTLIASPHSVKAVPIGLGARDTLRIEAKYSLYGNDIDESTTPMEAGLDWTLALNKADFIGKHSLIKQKQNGISRILVCIEMQEPGIPRQHCLIKNNDKVIGEITSGTHSPTLKKNIGIGYVSRDNAKIGQNVFIEIRGKNRLAQIIGSPFYKGGLYKKRLQIKK
ncbi:MAG: glycine cleavage system aminomethyltransferase GcvT [Candidatus Theseobacter exili]|nr:glycine cleavage system aminomethyltransferase GcvT [Candidatus Theseobacter exili]